MQKNVLQEQKKIIILFGMLVLFMFAMTAIMTTIVASSAASGQTPLTKVSAAEAGPAVVTLDEKVEAIVNGMSDEEKIGQLLIIGIGGSMVDETAMTMIRDYHIGGITLFDRNMDDPAQVAQLTNALQQQALASSGRLPLFICIDQEGGRVTRMAENVTAAPSQAEVAATEDKTQATIWAQRTARELKAMGINVNFAPVADVGAGRGRSYSTEAETVREFTEAAARGYQQENLIFTLKHFPGIGRAAVDPHLDASVIETDKAVLEKEDLVPFRALIQQYNNDTFFVMVSHLKYVAYDAEYPASVSSLLINNLLRQELGFKGLIVTDDLEMGALTKLYPYEMMGTMAVRAGADQVLVCHTPQYQVAVYTGMLTALKEGTLDKTTVNNAVRRIVRLKLQTLQQIQVDPDAAARFVGNADK